MILDKNVSDDTKSFMKLTIGVVIKSTSFSFQLSNGLNKLECVPYQGFQTKVI
jgi:hypothetical protein